MACQGLTDQADGTGVDLLADAAERSTCHRMPEPTGIAQLLDQLAAFCVHIMAVLLRDVVGGPGIELACQLLMASVEKRPFQIALIGHVSCL